MSNILDRIVPIFRKNYNVEVRDFVWNACMEKAIKVDLTEQNFENMCQTDLVQGYGGGGGGFELVRLAEAVGVAGIGNPENDAYHKTRMPPMANVDGLTPDQILDRIQSVYPFKIQFPEFSGNCLQGIQTKYGVTSNRHLFYLWVLKRVVELCPDRNTGIIEIGAGFGILGYYLHHLGYTDYTTIDLALINACQSYFLHKNLPERNLILSGEVENPFDVKHRDSIKLLHSSDFKSVPTNRFGLMVNMDGLTEYGVGQATLYVQSDCAPVLLSINHEVHPYRVCELPQPNRKMAYRYPFWLRPGYVEELYVPK